LAPPFPHPDTFMRLLIVCLLAALFAGPLRAETAAEILSANAALVEKASRQSIAPVIDALGASGDPMAAEVLAAWADKRLGIRKADGGFVLIAPDAAGFGAVYAVGPGPGEARCGLGIDCDGPEAGGPRPAARLD
jgi:urea transport system permease protein